MNIPYAFFRDVYTDNVICEDNDGDGRADRCENDNSEVSQERLTGPKLNYDVIFLD